MPKPKPLTLTLNDAILLALRNNPNIQNAELGRVVAKYALVVAKNEFEPKYSLTAALRRSFDKSDGYKSTSTNASLTPSIKYKTHYGTAFELTMLNPWSNQNYNPELALTILQPLIRGFGKAIVEANLTKALYSEQTSKLNFKSTIMDQVQTVITDYFAYFQAIKQTEIDKAMLKTYLNDLKSTVAQVKAGEKAKSEITTGQTNVANQRVIIETDINNQHQARYVLLDVLGLQLNSRIELPSKIDPKQLIKQLTFNKSIPNTQASQNFALKNNITYQVTRITLKNAKVDLMTAKNAQRWRLDLAASASQGGGTGGGDNAHLRSLVNGRNHDEEIGLELSIPIDDVQRKSTLISAKIAFDQATINLKEAAKQLKIDVNDQVFALKTQQRKLRLSKQALDLQAKTVNNYKIRYNLGEIDNFSLLQQQQFLNKNATDLLSDQIAYVNSLAAFNKSLGTLLDIFNIKIKY